MTAARPEATSGPSAHPAIGDVGRAFMRASARAEMFGILVAVIAVPAMSVALTIGLALTPAGPVWNALPFSWLSISTIAFVVGLVVVWTLAAIRFIPSSVRPAFEAFIWAGERSLEAMRATTGRADAPTSAPEAQHWLELNPETAANRWIRVEVLLIAGQVQAARATAERMAANDPLERYLKADALATTQIVESGTVNLEPLRAAAADLSDEARLDAEAAIAIHESRLALAAGEDWLAPFTDLRRRLGSAADGVLWRGYAVRRLRAATPVTLLVIAVFALLQLLFGG
jgi:hypothetical protein